jgi:hypothetical protein
MKLRPSILVILAVMLLVSVPSLLAQDGLLGASAERTGTACCSPDFEHHLAVADFDNDQKPDGALLLPVGLLSGNRSFRIELHVTSGKDDAIVFSAPEQSLSISAFDINRDGAPDIVIEKALTGQRIQVYLNDGHGSFHEALSDLYPLPDPEAHKLRAWFAQSGPSSYLLTARGFQVAGLNEVSHLPANQTCSFNSWPEKLLVLSGPRAPSHSRAPPSFLSL